MSAEMSIAKEYDLPSPLTYTKAVFPLKEHPLYGDLNNFKESPYLMPAELADFTNEYDYSEKVTNLEICPACFFNTSGTTNRSKKIPYSDDDLDRQRIHEAVALTKLGVGKGDGVISLGAPLPSISGWAIVNGSETTGAKVLNTCQLDYDDVLLRNQQDQATVVIGTPIVVKEIGLAIREDHGDLRKVFPNMRTGIIFGDVLPDALRKEIKEIWGFKNVYSLYGTVEADVVATESIEKPGDMELMSERLIIEIIPENELAKEKTNKNYQPIAYSLDEINDGTVGEIVISDLSRSVLPLIRYRIGDIIEVHKPSQSQKTTTVKVLGRSKNTVLVEKIPLYEMQINEAIESVLSGRVSEWRLIQDPDGAARYDLQVCLAPGQEINYADGEHILDALKSQRKELQSLKLASSIQVKWVDRIEQDEVKGDAKAKRIVLAE